MQRLQSGLELLGQPAQGLGQVAHFTTSDGARRTLGEIAGRETARHVAEFFDGARDGGGKDLREGHADQQGGETGDHDVATHFGQKLVGRGRGRRFLGTHALGDASFDGKEHDADEQRRDHEAVHNDPLRQSHDVLTARWRRAFRTG